MLNCTRVSCELIPAFFASSRKVQIALCPRAHTSLLTGFNDKTFGGDSEFLVAFDNWRRRRPRGAKQQGV